VLALSLTEAPANSDYVGSTLPEDVDDEDMVTVVIMDFFTNDLGEFMEVRGLS
jgi:hypothetical protein